MAKFELSITTDNAAFEDGNGGATHVAELLREAAEWLEENGMPLFSDKALMDSNGNKVGDFRYLALNGL